MDFNKRIRESIQLGTKLRQSAKYHKDKGDITLSDRFKDGANEIDTLCTIVMELKQRLISITGKEPT